MAVSLSFSVPNEPGVYFEIDPSLAGVTAQNKSKILVMGPKLAGGTAAADTPIFVPSESAIDTMFGAGSIISTMLHRVKQNYPAGELWALPQADPNDFG
jgi:phage tail sheath gpL-like